MISANEAIHYPQKRNIKVEERCLVSGLVIRPEGGRTDAKESKRSAVSVLAPTGVCSARAPTNAAGIRIANANIPALNMKIPQQPLSMKC